LNLYQNVWQSKSSNSTLFEIKNSYFQVWWVTSPLTSTLTLRIVFYHQVRRSPKEEWVTSPVSALTRAI
jgi:hypothetical protein